MATPCRTIKHSNQIKSTYAYYATKRDLVNTIVEDGITSDNWFRMTHVPYYEKGTDAYLEVNIWRAFNKGYEIYEDESGHYIFLSKIEPELIVGVVEKV